LLHLPVTLLELLPSCNADTSLFFEARVEPVGKLCCSVKQLVRLSNARIQIFQNVLRYRLHQDDVSCATRPGRNRRWHRPGFSL